MEWHEFDTRVAAYAVIVDENARVLLALWNGPEVPRWTMPGGGVELDERPQDAAVRELREETGYEIRVGALLGIDVEVIAPADRFSAAGRPLKAVRVVYRAEVTGGRLTNEVDGSTDEARWVPLAEVPELRRVPLVDTAIDLWRASARAPRLVVLAGRPGTGKTTLARRLAAALCGAHLRVDTVETALLGGGMASPGVVGYRIVHGLAAETLAAGTSVVVDAVNPVPEARAGWRELARERGCDVAVFETALHDHRLHRARVEARRPDLAGQRVPTWDQVRSVEYVPWDERRDGPRVVIDMTETDVGVARALASLG